MQDRTYTPPIIDPSGKSRAVSSDDADVIVEEKEEGEGEGDDSSSPKRKRPSVSSSADDKLAEQDLTKDAPDLAAQEEEFESYGFAHPAASRPQRIVWIPKDTLGLTEEEVKGCEEARVRVGFANAKMNESGKVDIDGGPPDLI